MFLNSISLCIYSLVIMLSLLTKDNKSQSEYFTIRIFFHQPNMLPSKFVSVWRVLGMNFSWSCILDSYASIELYWLISSANHPQCVIIPNTCLCYHCYHFYRHRTISWIKVDHHGTILAVCFLLYKFPFIRSICTMQE